jgi:hypothetical protein
MTNIGDMCEPRRLTSGSIQPDQTTFSLSIVRKVRSGFPIDCAKKSAKKKAAPEGAAKFREETPRKGCGAEQRRTSQCRAATICHRTAAQSSLNSWAEKYFIQSFTGFMRNI